MIKKWEMKWRTIRSVPKDGDSKSGYGMIFAAGRYCFYPAKYEKGKYFYYKDGDYIKIPEWLTPTHWMAIKRPRGTVPRGERP